MKTESMIEREVYEVKPGVSLDEIKEDDILIINGRKELVAFCLYPVNQPPIELITVYRNESGSIGKMLRGKYNQNNGQFNLEEHLGEVLKGSKLHKFLSLKFEEAGL